MSEKFDIYSKIFYRNVEKFVRHLCLLVLRHQMWVSNYFVNSFYSVVVDFISKSSHTECLCNNLQDPWPSKCRGVIYVLHVLEQGEGATLQ
jgi:hypothetical protein